MDLQNLGGTFIVLALVYVLAAVVAVTRLKHLHRHSPDLDMKKLFVMTILLSCVLRTMCFVAIAVLDFQSIKVSTSTSNDDDDDDDDQSSQEEFLAKGVIVLYDLPDFSIVSAYVLLCFVWAETFVQSRRHWFSMLDFRKQWLIAYTIFNVVLYLSQLVLYSLIFVPKLDESALLACIYLYLAAMNFVLPFLFTAGYIYFNVRFSGFPFTSKHAAFRVQKIGRVTVFWTVARLLWAFIALTTVTRGIFSGDDEVASIVIVAIFLVVEIGPFVMGMETSVLDSLVSSPQEEEPPPTDDAGVFQTAEHLNSPLLTEGYRSDEDDDDRGGGGDAAAIDIEERDPAAGSLAGSGYFTAMRDVDAL